MTNALKKAQIAIGIMDIADSMYANKDLAHKTASVLIYLNLVEWYLCFLVRQIPLNIPEEKFAILPLGGKIKKLEKVNFNYKTELLDLLNKVNGHRKKIIHNLIDTIFDNQMEKSIDATKILFDDLNKCLLLIMKSYGIS